VMFLIQMGTVPQSACLATIRNLGERVLPHFRALDQQRDGDFSTDETVALGRPAPER
jgi:hypothetical protein